MAAGSAGWGDNSYGQLGVGDQVNRGDEANEMVPNPSSVRATVPCMLVDVFVLRESSPHDG